MGTKQLNSWFLWLIVSGFFFFPSGPYPVLKPSAHLSESSNRKNVGSSFYLVYCHFNPVFCHSFYLKGEFLKKCCCT